MPLPRQVSTHSSAQKALPRPWLCSLACDNKQPAEGEGAVRGRCGGGGGGGGVESLERASSLLPSRGWEQQSPRSWSL